MKLNTVPLVVWKEENPRSSFICFSSSVRVWAGASGKLKKKYVHTIVKVLSHGMQCDLTMPDTKNSTLVDTRLPLCTGYHHLAMNPWVQVQILAWAVDIQLIQMFFLPIWVKWLMGTWGNLGKINCGNPDVILPLHSFKGQGKGDECLSHMQLCICL